MTNIILCACLKCQNKISCLLEERADSPIKLPLLNFSHKKIYACKWISVSTGEKKGANIHLTLFKLSVLFFSKRQCQIIFMVHILTKYVLLKFQARVF